MPRRISSGNDGPSEFIFDGPYLAAISDGMAIGWRSRLATPLYPYRETFEERRNMVRDNFQEYADGIVDDLK